MVTPQDIEDFLTLEGRTPLNCSFAVGGVIYLWGDKLPLKAWRTERDDLYQACMNYLSSQGRDFSSLGQAIAVAVQDQWPNLEKLPRGIVDNPRHRTSVWLVQKHPEMHK